MDKGRAAAMIRSLMTAREAFDAVSNGGLKDLETVLAMCRKHGSYCVIGFFFFSCNMSCFTCIKSRFFPPA